MTLEQELDRLHREYHQLHPHIRYGDGRCPVCAQWKRNARTVGS